MVQGQLEQDQEGGRERGELHQGLPSGDEGEERAMRPRSRARIAMRIGSSEVCPQMLKGEERPAWLAIVRS